MATDESSGGDAGPREGKGRRSTSAGAALCGVTDVGRVRDHNEDDFHVSPDGPLLVVADGLGGHAAGEVASAMAVAFMAEALDASRLAAVAGDAGRIEALLIDAFLELQGRMLAEAGAQPSCWGMGTTLVVALVDGGDLHVCHVGDSRCYVRNAGGLQQVTSDHSLVGVLVAAGELTAEEGRVHPRRNQVLQAIGLPTGINPEICRAKLAPGDRVLVCSDGLWEELDDEDICAILDGAGSTAERAARLVDDANRAGGRDNVTVALYEHGPGRP
ncbi:MAG: PP2C family serine/threonine-protein phosphatase [Candidatus Binatia bacterium]